MPDERAAFRDFKSSPTPDNLIRLLRTHQDRIYRLCFQVLRRAHDAEDAAQEVLIRIVDGVRKVDDADAFRRWVHRVSLNAALEAARKASRRRAHETRAVMKDSPREPLDEESRCALFEAIAKLDDGPRELLLDHHFEGETLDSLASRERVSPQAVQKRLERAREELKRALPAGFLGVPDLGRLFEREVVTPVAPDLVSGPVLAKVHTAGAGLAAGGVMTAKSSIPALGILVAVLLLVAGSVVTVLLRRGDAPVASSGARPASTAATSPGPLRDDGIPHTAGETPVATNSTPPTTSSPLRSRLDRFKKWWIAIEREREGVKGDHVLYAAYRKRWDEEHWEQVRGLRDLILEDPEGFLTFLRDRENEAVIGDLTRTSLLDQTDRPMVWQRKPFQEYPPELMSGLLELLRSGTVPLCSAALNLVGGLDDVPQEYKNLYLALLDDPDKELQRQSIPLVMRMVPMTPSLFSKLAAMGTQSGSLYVRLRVVSSMAFLPGPEAEAFVLNRLAVATHQNELMQITFSLESRYRGARRSGVPILEEQMARAVIEAMARNYENYVLDLMPVATFLSADRLKPILQQAMAKTQYDWYRERLSKAVERIDQGPLTRDDLMKILDPPR